MKKHCTRRKGVANIKDKVFDDHGVPNADDGDTPAPNIDDDNIDDFVVEYHWEGAYRSEVLIENTVLQLIGVKLEDK